MQLLARLMDHVLAKRGRRATIAGATSGDTGGAAIEAFRTSKRVDVVILFPEGRVSDVQRRMMTTPKEANVHAVAIQGTFDDAQALVKAMFNDHAFRDRVQLSGVNSINWARIVAQATYYFVAASALGGPLREVSFVVPTGNFGDIFAGYVAAADGAADRQSGYRLERERHPAANDRDGALSDARRRCDVVAIDGHPDFLEFRALSVRSLRSRRGRGPRNDGRAGAIGRLRSRRTPFESKEPIQGGAGEREGSRGRDFADIPRGGLPARSAHGLRRRRGRQGARRQQRTGTGHSFDGASGQVSRCHRGDHGYAPGTSGTAFEPDARRGTFRGSACRTCARSSAISRACRAP